MQLKGRFGSSMDSPPDGIDMAKSMCDAVIYGILAGKDPKEYPVRPGSSPITDYSSSGGSCTVTEDGSSMTLHTCDCSDPENYSFYNEGKFKI